MRYCLILSLLLSSIAVFGQSFVKDEGITSALHQENISRVRFMGRLIPAAIVKGSDYLDSIELKDSMDFNIRVYLSRSLTNYLHPLSPSSPKEELTAKGNYQFSFWVDDSLIYKEDLHPGAGTADSKNTMTVFRVPLISTTNEDSWGRFLWNRFMFRGGEDALQPGTHRLKIEIRPYVKTAEAVRVGEIIAAGSINIIVAKPHVPESLKAVQPIAPGSGWQLSEAVYDHEKIKSLNEKIISRSFKDITSIIVIRDGRLLLEEYFNGAGRDSLHDTRSVGKTFASALTGIAIKDRHIKNEQQQLSGFYNLKGYTNYTPAKDSVTLKHLLTMSSGFNGSDDDQDSPGNEENMYPAPDWVKFALGLPMDTNRLPGRTWTYFTAGVVVLGDILNSSVPGGLERYADKKLFRPLGIRKYQWEYTPQKVANTAGGLRMRPLDLARFGQLYKNKGSWKGRQLIPESWVHKSLSQQLPLPGSRDEYYGYLFWNRKYAVQGRQYETYYMSGNGGNKVYIFKDLPLVVVITSVAYNKPYGHVQADKIMERYILPAVIN